MVNVESPLVRAAWWIVVSFASATASAITCFGYCFGLSVFLVYGLGIGGLFEGSGDVVRANTKDIGGVTYSAESCDVGHFLGHWRGWWSLRLA